MLGTEEGLQGSRTWGGGEGRTLFGTNECPKYGLTELSMAKTLYLYKKKSDLTRMEYGAKAWERSADDHTAKKPTFTLMHGLTIF